MEDLCCIEPSLHVTWSGCYELMLSLKLTKPSRQGQSSSLGANPAAQSHQYTALTVHPCVPEVLCDQAHEKVH